MTPRRRAKSLASTVSHCHREAVLDDATVDQLDTTFTRWVRERDLSGGVLVTHGDSVLFERYYGLADRAAEVPVSARTRFGLASVTKLFTAVAVTDLVTAGKLRYDERVAAVLPARRRPSTLHPEVAIHHLLTHTSGIADYAEEDEDSPGYVEDYGALWRERPSYQMLCPDDFLPMYGDLPPYRPPGQKCQYSNAGYVLLAAIIEEITATPYVEVVQSRVFDRAGMTSSGFFRLDEPCPHTAVGYLPRASPDDPWRSNIYQIPVIGGGDGGAFSTAHDLDLFLKLLADGTLLGDQRDIALARHVDAGEGFSRGYGIYHHPLGFMGHGGGDPGVEVFANRYLDRGVNMIVLCNTEGVAFDVRAELIAALPE